MIRNPKGLGDPLEFLGFDCFNVVCINAINQKKN